jgi:hypothetical protein
MSLTFTTQQLLQHLGSLPPDLKIPISYAVRNGRAPDVELLQAAEDHLVRQGRLVPQSAPGTAAASAGATEAGQPDRDARIPGDSRARAHACADHCAPSLPTPNIPNGTKFESLIQTLATASLQIPNKEAWPMLLQGLKARGIDPVTATALRPRIWARRAELVKADKARLREAARTG